MVEWKIKPSLMSWLYNIIQYMIIFETQKENGLPLQLFHNTGLPVEISHNNSIEPDPKRSWIGSNGHLHYGYCDCTIVGATHNIHLKLGTQSKQKGEMFKHG